MANPKIEVEIGAKVQGLQQGVDLAEKELNQLGRAADSVSPKINKLTQATSNYNGVGVEFARIIQDAPFGIIGVGNNITQLASSFQAARNQGASFTKIIGGIFSSSNLLILGISALTTVFTVLQQKGFFKSEEAAKSLKDRLDEYKESLESVAKASLDGASSAQKEVQSLILLRKQAENTAVSQGKRLEAVNELQKEYPEYFGNLSKEAILNGQADTAYQNAAKAILTKAKAQASANEIAKNAIQILTIETKLEEQRSKRLAETASAQAQIDNLLKRRNEQGFLTQGEIDRYNTLIGQINKANEGLASDAELLEEKARLLEQNVKLEENVTSLIEQGATFTNAQNEAKKEQLNLLDQIVKKYKEQEDAILRNLKAQRQINQDPLLKAASGLKGTEGDNLFTTGPKDFGIGTGTFDPNKNDQAQQLPLLDQILGEILLKTPKIEERLTTFAFNVNDILQNQIGGAFIALGYSIGEALATGGNVIQAIGQSLLQSIAGFLGQLGEQLILFGVAGGAFGKLSLALTNPLTAIESAPLAIAAGVALTAAAGAIGSIGRRGIGGGSSVGSSGVSGGTSQNFGGSGLESSFINGLQVSGLVEIDGTKILIALENAEKKRNRG